MIPGSFRAPCSKLYEIKEFGMAEQISASASDTPVQSCLVLVVGGGPAGLSVARGIGAGAVVVHQDAQIGVPVRTSGGSWKRHLDALDIPPDLYHEVKALRFASDSEEHLFEFRSHVPVALDMTGTCLYLAGLARARGAEIRCGHKLASIDTHSTDQVVATVTSAGDAYRIRANYVIDASGYARAALTPLDPNRYQNVATGAQIEFEDLSAQRDIATLIMGSRYTNPGYGWIFPTTQGKVRIGVTHTVPDVQSSPRESLDALIESGMPARFSVATGTRISSHGGMIPNWGPCKVFGIGRVLGVGDSVGQVSPLAYEGIRYSIENGRFLGTMLATALQTRQTPESVLEQYTSWWNKRYRKIFLASQWFSEQRVHFTRSDWNRVLGMMAKLKVDDIGHVLQTEISASLALRMAMANRDLPGKMLKELVTRFVS